MLQAPSSILGLFLELCRIASPPGEERPVADRVVRELRLLGLDVEEDDAGTAIGSTIGNLLCRLPGRVEGTPIFFCAHLDTVPPQGSLEPVVEEMNREAARLALDGRRDAADAPRQIMLPTQVIRRGSGEIPPVSVPALG